MTDLKTFTGDSPEEFNPWLLSIEKVSTLTSYNLKDICFTKAEVNLLKFYIHYHGTNFNKIAL